MVVKLAVVLTFYLVSVVLGIFGLYLRYHGNKQDRKFGLFIVCMGIIITISTTILILY